MIRTILYATDLGLYAPYVLQHALALTRAFHANLYVIHAVEPMGLFAESVLQTYLDEERLKELRSNGLGTVMSSIEQRVLEGRLKPGDRLPSERDLCSQSTVSRLENLPQGQRMKP